MHLDPVGRKITIGDAWSQSPSNGFIHDLLGGAAGPMDLLVKEANDFLIQRQSGAHEIIMMPNLIAVKMPSELGSRHRRRCNLAYTEAFRLASCAWVNCVVIDLRV